MPQKTECQTMTYKNTDTRMRTHLEFYTNNASTEDNLELLDMSDACLWMLDDQLKLLSFNKVYQDHMISFTGITPKTGENDVVVNYFPPDFAQNIKAMYDKAMTGETVRSFERGFQPDGTRADTVMIFKPAYDNKGTIKGVCCLRRDVSDLFALKKELDHKDEKLSELIWQQSHLFRGPLSTAIGIADILDEVLTGRQISADECKEMLSGLRLKLKELDDLIRSIVKSAQG